MPKPAPAAHSRTSTAIRPWLLTAVSALCLVCASCGSKTDFDGGKARAILQSTAVNLDGEQVSLTQAQLDCGVQSDLWEAPVQVSQDRTTARLTAQGRALNFSDDPAIEADFHQPIAQVRGAFSLEVNDVSNIRDGDSADVKLVDGKAGVRLQHACFSNPLPLMGVRKGKFREDAPLTFLFRLKEDGWHYDSLVH